MSVTLILASALAAGPVESRARPAASAPVNRSLSDSDRLRELEIAIRAAQARGEISRAAETELHFGIARTRRQMLRMGLQVSYRQRVRLRERIDRLYARLGQRSSDGR